MVALLLQRASLGQSDALIAELDSEEDRSRLVWTGGFNVLIESASGILRSAPAKQRWQPVFI